MTITEVQLERINHIRTREGRNGVTMETAEILLNLLGEQGREEVMRRIGVDWEISEVLKLSAVEEKVAAERERCARIADQWADEAQGLRLHVGDDLEETIKSTQVYVARVIAGKIRSGE